MVLRKSLWGLFFFLFWGTVLSQGDELEIVNASFVDLVQEEDMAFYRSVIGGDNNDMLDKEEGSGKLLDSHNVLLHTLTVEEKKSQRFNLHVLKINSEYSDYAPCYYNGELVFASSRNMRSMSKAIDKQSNQPFLDLYITEKKSTKDKIKKLKGDVNTKFHESSPSFSKDGKTVYFTRNNYSNKKSASSENGTVLLKIYRAHFVNDKWDNVEELPFNSDEYSNAHPALSPDGKYLYFASDMPGSVGKSDLYVVEIKEDGNFGIPLNLGEQINTPGRETFPYVSDKGNLFFTSDGHLGYGGLDIFMMQYTKNKGVQVYNLGKPINSDKDDFTFVVNEQHKLGYFSSNRLGGKGGDDIYGFKQLVPFNEKSLPKPKTLKKMERIMNLKPNDEEITSW